MSGPKKNPIFDFLNNRIEANKAKSGYGNIIEPYDNPDATLDTEELTSSQNKENVSPEVLDYLKLSTNERKSINYVQSEAAQRAAQEDKLAFEESEKSIKDLDTQIDALKKEGAKAIIEKRPVDEKTKEQLSMLTEQRTQIALNNKDNQTLQGINDKIKKLEDPYIWNGADTDTPFLSNPLKWTNEAITNIVPNVHNLIVNPENKMTDNNRAEYLKLKKQRDTFYKPIAEQKIKEREEDIINLKALATNPDINLTNTSEAFQNKVKDFKELSLKENIGVGSLINKLEESKREMEAYLNGEDGSDNFLRKLGRETIRVNEGNHLEMATPWVNNLTDFFLRNDLENRAGRAIGKDSNGNNVYASGAGYHNLSDKDKKMLELYSLIDEDKAFLSDKQKWSYNTMDSTMNSVGFIRDMVVGDGIAKGVGGLFGLGEGTALSAATRTLEATGSKVAGRVAAAGVKGSELAASYAIQNQLNPQYINQELMKGSHIERDEQGNVTNIYVKDKLYDYMAENYKQVTEVYKAEKVKLEAKNSLSDEEQKRLDYLNIKLGEQNSMGEHSLQEELATFKPSSMLNAEVTGFVNTSIENLTELYTEDLLHGIGKGLSKIPGVNKLTSSVGKFVDKLDYGITGTKFGKFYKNLTNATGKLNINGARVIGSIPEEVAEEWVGAVAHSVYDRDPKQVVDMFDVQANIDIAAQTLLMSAGFGLGGTTQTYAKLGYNNLINKRLEDLKGKEAVATERLPMIAAAINEYQGQLKDLDEGTPEHTKLEATINGLKEEQDKQQAIIGKVKTYKEKPSLTGLNIMDRLPGVTDSTFSATKNYVESRQAIRKTIDTLKSATNDKEVQSVLNLNSLEGFGISEQKLKIDSLKSQGKEEQAALAEKALFQNLVLQSFRGGVQDEFKKSLDKLQSAPGVSESTKLQVLKAKEQMEVLGKTYDLNKDKPNLSNILTLAMEKLSAKEGIEKLEADQNKISTDVANEIDTFKEVKGIDTDYALDTLFTRTFEDEKEQDKYDNFIEQLSDYTNPAIESYFGLNNAKDVLKKHLNNTALALSEAIHPSLESVNKDKFLEAVTQDYNDVLEGRGNIEGAEFNYNNQFKPTKEFVEQLFDSKKKEWIGKSTEGKISQEAFNDLKAKAVFNINRELIKEKIAKAQVAQDSVDTKNQEKDKTNPVIKQDELFVIADTQGEAQFTNKVDVVEQDLFIFFEDPKNSGPVINMDDMIENYIYTPEQLAFVKKAMGDIVSDIQSVTGQDKVSFKEAMSQYYKYFKNKDSLKDNFRHFAKGWKENGYEVSNGEILDTFDSLFAKEADVMKVEEGIRNLFEQTVTPDTAPAVELEDKVAEIQKEVAETIPFTVTYDEENNPVVKTAVEEINTQRTFNILPKLGFNAISYEEVIENGILVRKATESTLNIKDTDLIDFRDLINPDMYYAGTGLSLELADENLWPQINVSNGRDDKGNVKVIPFNEWVAIKENTNPDFRNSAEFNNKRPVFFTNEKGKRLAYVQDVDWYNPFNVANPYGESNNPNMPTAEWLAHINEGRENTARFRDAIAKGLNRVTVERLSNEGVFHKLLDEEPLISLNESNPQSFVTVQRGEVLDNLPAEFTTGQSVLLNKESDFDITKTNGHTWAVYRIGSMYNDKQELVKTYRAFPINRQVTADQVENVRWALAAFSAYSGNSLPVKYRMTKEQALEKFIKPINKATGLNITDPKGLMDYVKAHFQLSSNTVYALRRDTDKSAYTADSAVLYLRLLLEDNSMLENPAVLDMLSQHTNSKLLKTKFNAVDISKAGVESKAKDGKPVSYQEYLKDTLLINIKSFNVGTETSPVYATVVQPIINVNYDEVIAIQPTVAEKIKEATTKVLEEIKQVDAPTLEDHVNFFDSIGVDIEAFENFDDLIENVDKFRNLFNLTGNLNVVQEKTIRQFIVHAIGEKIDFDYKTKISREKVRNEVKSEVNLQLRAIENKAKALSENVNVPEDKKVLIEAAYKSVLENITSIQNNFTTIFDKAFEDIKKQTQLTEIEEEEKVSNDDESLTLKDYTKESIEESGKSKASYRLRRFLHKIPKYDASGNVVTGYLGFPEYMTFNDVYNELTRVLSLGSEIVSDYKLIVEKLQKSESPFIKDIIKKLETADQQIKNELVYNFVRHSLSSKFGMFESNSKGTSLKVYDTNANQINRIILNRWINESKASSLYMRDGSFSTNHAADLITQFKAFDKNLDNVDTDMLRNWLEQVGMYMHDKTWETLLAKGLYNGSKQYSFKELYSLNKGGLFHPIVTFLENGIKKPVDYAFANDKQAFYDLKGVTNAISNIEASYNPQLVALSYRDSGKNISTQVPTKFFTDKVQELKRGAVGGNTSIQDLRDLSFSEDSIILELLQEDPTFKTHFEASHISLTAFKERGKNPSRAGLTELGDLDYDMLTLTGFQDRKVGNLSPETKIDGVSMRLAHMVAPTMSDKSTGLLVKTAVFDLMRDADLMFNRSEDSTLSLDSGLKSILFKYLVLPELKRIIKFHSQVKTTNIKNYDKAATIFHLIPVMNTLKGESGMSIIEELAVTENYSLQDITDKYQGVFEDALEKVITAEVNHKKETWKPFVEQTEHGPVSTMFDSNYFSEVNKMAAHNYDVAVYDYVINSMVFNADIFKVFAGDIANYSQDKLFKGEDNIYDIQDPAKYISINKQIGVNLGKRLALLIAPGGKMANSEGEKYNQIMLQDSVDITENANYLIGMYYGKDAISFAAPLIEKYNKAAEIINQHEQGEFISPEILQEVKDVQESVKKDLTRAYPLLGGYFDIESTDAQEYTTASEHIENQYRMGRLNDRQYQNILNKINSNSNLNKQELKLVLQPMKPVATGTYINKAWDINRVVYIKSSSFPLLPQFTAGTKLDALRIKMEELESNTGRFTRASFQTANKVGATKNTVNPFDVNSLEKIKEYSDTDVDSTVLVLDRNNFRNQQDVPFKSDKEVDDKVSMGTQFFKLLFGDGIINESGFTIDGKSMTGRELYSHFNTAFTTILDTRKQELFLDLGLSERGEVLNQAVFVTKLQQLLTKEATDRGYSIKSLRGLKVEQLAARAGYYYEFKTPLWLSSDSNRYESLLNSIVTNRIMKHKFPGNGFVAGSESGMRMKEDLSGINKSEIIYLSNWNGKELQGTKNENGQFTKAQVFAPSKFKHNKKLIDLFEDYNSTSGEGKYIIKGENGALTLRPGMIADELLNNFSFRTPTSSHVSGSSIEIAGFLPAEMGDLMIVPKNFTKQKGLDFDVDKENTYQLNHFMNEDGSIEALQAKHIEGEINKLEELFNEFDLENTILDRKSNARLDIATMALGSDIFTEESLQDLLTPDMSVKDKLERVRLELERKLAENEFIKSHLAVFNNPSDKVQSKINKILSIDFAKEQADKIEALNEEGKKNAEIQKYITEDTSLSLLDAEAKYKENSMNFNMLTYSYQKEKMSLGSIGKIAIGVYANYTTFNGLVQQNPGTQFISQSTPEGPIAKIVTIGSFKSNGILGAERTLDGERTIAEVFAEKENTATDNEKEQVLGRVGVDEFTINTDATMTLRGFDKDENGNSISYMLLSQPVVKQLNTIRKNSRGTLGEFTPDDSVIYSMVNRLSDGEAAWFGGKAVYAASLEEEEPVPYPIEGSLLTGTEMLNGIKSNGTDNKIQLHALLTYLTLEKEGKGISKVQKTINVNTLGKSMIESQLKYQGLQELASNTFVAGADVLLGDFREITPDSSLPEGYVEVGDYYVKATTPQGQIVINGLHLGNTLYKDFFPYQEQAVLSVINEILTIQDKTDASDNILVDQFETIVEEVRKYIYSREQNNIFEGDPRQKRFELFKDTEDNTSLSTYLKDLFKGDITSNGKGIKAIRANALIKSFNFETGKGENEVSLIKYNNAATDNLDEESLYNAIPELILLNASLPDRNGRTYTTKDLAEDLVNYAYLEGGIQEANQFIKFVPVEYLESVGKYENVHFYKNGEVVTANQFIPANRKFQEFNSKRNPTIFETAFGFNENGPSTFTKQYFQNNPEQAPKTNFTKVEKFNVKSGTFRLKDGLSRSEFLAMRNKRGNADKYSLYQHVGDGNYQRINLLGQIGISEYDYQNPVAISLRDKEGISASTTVGTSSEPTKALEITDKTTIQDFLGQIGKADLAPEYQHLKGAATALAPFAMPKGSIIVTPDIPGAGRANHITGDVMLHPDAAFADDNRLAMTFVHEFIHTISRNEIDKYFDAKGQKLRTDITVPSYVTDLVSVFSEFRKIHQVEIDALEDKIKSNLDNSLGLEYTDREKDFIYAGTNIREFLSIALTSPLFHSEMNNVPYKSAGKSFVQKVVDVIMKLLATTYKDIRNDTLGYAAIQQSLGFIAQEHADKISQAEIIPASDLFDDIDPTGDINFGGIDLSQNNPASPDLDLSIDNVSNEEDFAQDILTLPDCI